MSPTAFVSGATGYIAQHIVALLLSKDYQVVGSVRSEEKGQHFAKLFNSSHFSYVVVPDIAIPGAFDEAFKAHPAISTVFHVASPFHLSSENVEQNLLKPLIEGTKNILSAIKSFGTNVRRVVLTSSAAAVEATPGYDYADKLVNEDSWTELTYEQALKNGIDGYSGSKVFAEKAAWEFANSEHKPHFDMAVVNPVFVFGPQAFESEAKENLNSSVGHIDAYLKLKPTDPYPTFEGKFTDVRDVAKAHIVAAESAEAANQRLVLCNGGFVPQKLANIIREHFPKLRETIPVGTPENENAPLQNPFAGKLDNSKTNKILGFEQISLEQSVVDTVSQILKSRE
ncbi:NADPH-dependent methylglyoxal reductase GRE2 [Suhomyces tanzawaensis NRRL Y-17324]|uniref:NADPH-dependent methylglyoxal reductase GRE2 n=1 Tax=Suhomyces tanzawaensis NRRL Y-17324 TaxID=984487 RepID=A0A1E4SPZ8_9ASCO|nr:NADPH-dependent methylglyoxal reductase GRE2 [Suhomyces tanzawaensis NRRL Y-17324]ODV81507.1 NADPH-dependent methylglyoxal reductase GRE2 [Suhomyces tanzawaensis NRRL Y-17324]